MRLLKATYYSSNFIFFALGCGLMWISVHVSSHPDYTNLGQLLQGSMPKPLLSYLTFAVFMFGVAKATLGLIASSALYHLNKLLFVLFIFAVMVLLIGEITLIIFTAVNPKYIGLTIIREELVDDWQRNYAVPGREQYTAAIDYTQSVFGCCGAGSGSDFVTSWWKLRELGASDLVVPLSCCLQSSQVTSHLDPRPANQSSCQDEDVEINRSARYTQGCSIFIQEWLNKNIKRALSYCLICITYQFYLLLLAIYSCLTFLFKNK